MAITILTATEPDVIPAIPERVCGVWGAYQTVVGWNGSTLNMSIEARKFGMNESGVYWSRQEAAVINSQDLFAEAAVDPLAENLVNALTAYMQSKLEEQGVL